MKLHSVEVFVVGSQQVKSSGEIAHADATDLSAMMLRTALPHAACIC